MKRFTATEKWQKEWYRKLPPHIKCLWQFMCDNCDAAGVWEADWDTVSFLIGKKVEESDLRYFEGKLAKMKGKKFLIGSFVEFQCGRLSEECRAHLPIFRLIEKHRVSNGYTEAMNSLKEKEQGEDKEKEADQKEGVQGEPRADLESRLQAFDEFWKAYPRKAGRGDAERAWTKLGCTKLLPQILMAIRDLKISEDWTKDGGQFIPHPATWINREGWHDELPKNGNSSTLHTTPSKYGF